MFKIPWHKLPTPLALLQLVQFRSQLRENNLRDTSQLLENDQLPKPQPSPDGRHLVARTADGSFNDLDQPAMGMAGTRFGRNSPLADSNLTPDWSAAYYSSAMPLSLRPFSTFMQPHGFSFKPMIGLVMVTTKKGMLSLFHPFKTTQRKPTISP